MPRMGHVQNGHAHRDRVGSWVPGSGEGWGVTADGDGDSFRNGEKFPEETVGMLPSL